MVNLGFKVIVGIEVKYRVGTYYYYSITSNLLGVINNITQRHLQQLSV